MNAVQRTRLRLLGFVAGVVLSLSLSRLSRASIWPSDGAIVNGIIHVYFPWMGEFIDDTKRYIKYLKKVETDMRIKGTGKASDSIRSNMDSLHNDHVNREGVAPADLKLIAAMLKLRNPMASKERERQRLYTYNGDAVTATLTDADVKSQRRYRIAGKQVDGGIPDISASCASQIAQGYGAGDNGDLFKLAERLLGLANDMATNAPGPLTRAGARYADLRTTHVARLSSIRTVLQRMVAERQRDPKVQAKLAANANAEQKKILKDLGGDKGLSDWDVWRYEVASTYGSSQWRSALDHLPSSTSVMKTFSDLVATNNALRKRLLQADEDRSMLLAAAGISSLDTPAKSEQLKTAYDTAVH